MTTYTFTTPVVEEGPTGGHRLFYFFRLNRGITVVRDGETYSTGRWFTQDQLDAYDEYWLGGHIHTGISEATKAAMIAADIDVTETNFVAE
jgi:hypothetical protein